MILVSTNPAMPLEVALGFHSYVKCLCDDKRLQELLPS